MSCQCNCNCFQQWCGSSTAVIQRYDMGQAGPEMQAMPHSQQAVVRATVQSILVPSIVNNNAQPQVANGPEASGSRSNSGSGMIIASYVSPRSYNSHVLQPPNNSSRSVDNANDAQPFPNNESSMNLFLVPPNLSARSARSLSKSSMVFEPIQTPRSANQLRVSPGSIAIEDQAKRQ